MSNDAGWYFESLGEWSGPFSAKEMQDHAKRGAIEPLTMVKKGSGGEWVPAESVKGFEFGKAQQPVVELPPKPVVPKPVVADPTKSFYYVRPSMMPFWRLFEVLFIGFCTVVISVIVLNPPADRFQDDNAVGATANALERLEFKIGSIFAFCLAVVLFRSLHRVWDKPIA